MSTFILLFSFWDFYYQDVRPSQRIFLIFLSFFFSYFPLFCFSGLLQGKFPPLFLPFCYILNFHELFFFLTLIFYCTLMHTTYHFLISPKILIIAFFFFSLQVTLFCVCVCVCILCSCLFFLFLTRKFSHLSGNP